MKAKFYICEHCGNLVTTIHNAGVPLVCCGEKMKELLPNTVEASGEKHLPVAEHSGSTLTVTVGAVEHPMVDVHHIQWSLWRPKTVDSSVTSPPVRHPRRCLSWAAKSRWRSTLTATCMVFG